MENINRKTFNCIINLYHEFLETIIISDMNDELYENMKILKNKFDILDINTSNKFNKSIINNFNLHYKNLEEFFLNDPLIKNHLIDISNNKVFSLDTNVIKLMENVLSNYIEMLKLNNCFTVEEIRRVIDKYRKLNEDIKKNELLNSNDNCNINFRIMLFCNIIKEYNIYYEYLIENFNFYVCY